MRCCNTTMKVLTSLEPKKTKASLYDSWILDEKDDFSLNTRFDEKLRSQTSRFDTKTDNHFYLFLCCK